MNDNTDWRAVSAEMSRKVQELLRENEELRVLMKRAVRLSIEHPDFKLYAMEPFTRVIERG